MLQCKKHPHQADLPLRIGRYYAMKQFQQSWQDIPVESLLGMAEASYDAFMTMMDLLRSKHSNFVKGEASELDLMFSNHNRSLTTKDFSTVFQWLLAVSAWKKTIRTFDQHIQKFSNTAMSKPSLETFRSIVSLRENITDMKDALRREENKIGGEATSAFTGLQEITNHQLESLNSVFETLLTETDALSARASNEIQLVIGSLAIQVLSLC